VPVPRVDIPKAGNAKLKVQGNEVSLTNLDKPFWPELGITKGDLIQYYADVAPLLLPHIQDRAMVMKRYPHGAHGEFFFMKRAPSPRPTGSAPAASITTRATSSTSR
jgi:bifunctional non-homologous end joining protein LigD